MYRYDLISFTKSKDGIIDRTCDFKACVFLNDPNDDYKLLTVGSDTQRGMFRIYD